MLLEEDEQKLVIEYLELNNLKFSAIPNSTYTTSWNQKRKNKETGLRKGLPDLLIIIKNKLLFIEMKRIKGGRLSIEQKEWLDSLNKCNCVDAYVCNGFDEAKIVIDKYLHVKRLKNKELITPYEPKDIRTKI